jgi:hypothetical protein
MPDTKGSPGSVGIALEVLIVDQAAGVRDGDLIDDTNTIDIIETILVGPGAIGDEVVAKLGGSLSEEKLLGYGQSVHSVVAGYLHPVVVTSVVLDDREIPIGL